MWSDNETVDDLFGFRVHADLIRELIKEPSVLPATIGVFGDWGGGKSSIMRMLKEDFEKGDDAGPAVAGNKGVAVLYFNGWLFEGYDDAKAALLSSILTELRENKRFGPALKNKISGLLKRVDYMRGARMLFKGALIGGAAAATGGLGLAAFAPLLAAGALSGLKGVAADAAKEVAQDALDKQPETEADEALSNIRQFREEFADMLEKSEIKTLVVLIDDLDRCSPERIIENLEAIKLFLNVPQTAFVIGADRRVIRQAVAWRYREALNAGNTGDEGEDGRADRLVDDYLEKLIQIPYRLPRLSPSEIESYLTLLFCKRHLPAIAYGKVCLAANKQRTNDRYTTFGRAHALAALKGENETCPPELSEALGVGSSIASQITDVLQGNPRQVKRFLNAFFLRKKLASVAKLDDVKDGILVKLMLLEYAKPKLFDKLFSGMDGSTGLVGMLGGMEPKGEQPAKELPAEWAEMRKWLEMAPLLGEVDLRDYMWVTRDRLGSTMSGTIMVPPVVRSLLRRLQSKMGDVAARKDIPALQLTERAILAEMLLAEAQKKPGETKAFTALMEMAETDPVLGETLQNTIIKMPKDGLAPGLAILIVTRAEKPGDFGLKCKKIVSALPDGNSPFEKSLRQRKR